MAKLFNMPQGLHENVGSYLEKLKVEARVGEDVLHSALLNGKGPEIKALFSFKTQNLSFELVQIADRVEKANNF